MVPNLLNRGRRAEKTPAVDAEEFARLQLREAELRAQLAELEADEQTSEEPSLDVQLARVNAAIETAARESASAAIHGDHAMATAASDRQARLMEEQSVLRARKAEEDRAALEVHLRDQMAALHTETSAGLASSGRRAGCGGSPTTGTVRSTGGGLSYLSHGT